jgi:S1-C subfamily serine protease
LYRRQLFVFLLLAVLCGFVGGLLAPCVVSFYKQRMAVLGQPTEKNLDARQAESAAGIREEDKVITDLVEKQSAGVVSIIISKDLPQAQPFFGNGYPFFFSPFGSQDQNEGSKDKGTTEKRRIGSGSGFFISADGLIVTNKHVVADEQAEYTIIVSGGQEYPATVLARDPNNDIAVLKIEGHDFPALTLGDSDTMKVGQTVLAIGNPLGEFANSVSRGIISGVKRNLSAGSGLGMSERLTDIIQTDAAINPGNSGGPLFDLSGNVIGVNVAIAQGAENIGFALPINQVKRIAEQVRTTGKITTPYIGVRYVILNKSIQAQNNLAYDYGALILRGQTMTDLAVIPGGPGDKAGLAENDIILEINGTRVDTEHPLSNLIGAYNVGEEITLKVWHKGETKDVKLKLEERK